MFLPGVPQPAARRAPRRCACLSLAPGALAFTTDSYVVRPLFFPGGDIGTLAVNGTVNDLAMCGARPLYLSAGFILEEGLPMETLRRVVHSMQRAAPRRGVRSSPATPRSSTAARATASSSTPPASASSRARRPIAPASVRAGRRRPRERRHRPPRHGRSWPCARGLAFESAIESDCAPLVDAGAGTARGRD